MKPYKFVLPFIFGIFSLSAWSKSPVSINVQDSIHALTQEPLARYLLKTGYRYFIETKLVLSQMRESFADDYEYVPNAYSVLTTHGYQINPYFFVGGGVGITEYNSSRVAVPLYADVRTDFINHGVRPYAEVKGGFSPIHNTGAYFSLDGGVSFGLWNHMALSLFMGYTYQHVNYTDTYTPQSDYSNTTIETHKFNQFEGIDFGVSLSF